MDQLVSIDTDTGLITVQPQDLQTFWPVVRPGLTKCKKHSGSHWIEEDIYVAVRNGASSLHVGYIDCQYVGFAVCTITRDFDGAAVHFWCVYNASRHDIIERFLPKFDELARKAGARRMTFWSRRRWDRRIKAHGFERGQTEFVREL